MRIAVSLVLRGLVLAGLWWVLVEGRPGYVVQGLVVVPLALLVSLWLSPVRGGAPGSRPPRGAGASGRSLAGLRLVGWYSRQVVAGGVDVARRLLRREPDVAPVVRRMRSHLPPGAARQLAVGMYGLMPGAVVCGTDGDDVWLHSLDAAMRPEQQWRALEERVARAAGLDLDRP